MIDVVPYLPVAALALAALTVASAVVTWRTASGAMLPAVAPQHAPPSAGQASPRRGAAARALGALSQLRGGGEAVELPLVAVLGAPGACASRLAWAGAFRTPGEAPDAVQQSGVARVLAAGDGAILDFGDGLLAGEAWRETWRAALDRLGGRRAQGPLDAIVIAVPFGMLAGSEAAAPGELAQLGQTLGTLLEDVQREGGLSVPVYLALAAADAERGFAALAEGAFHEGSADTIIGWSSPHGVDTPYDPGWAEAAVETISAAFDGLTYDALAGSGSLPIAVVELGISVRALAAPLRVLLEPMMRPAPMLEPMMLRGIYLTGGAAEDIPATFAEGLFAEKVFPETTLARPARSRATRTARTGRRLRLAAAGAGALGLAGLGLLALHDVGDSEVRELLEAVDRFTAGNLAAERAGAPVAQPLLVRQTEELFRRMAALRIESVRTWLAPTSRLSDIDRRVLHAMAAGFDTVVLQALGNGLVERVGAVAAAVPPTAERTPESLERLASELAVIDTDVVLFASLPQSEDPSELATLSRDTIGIAPPPGFDRSYGLYISALALTDTRGFRAAAAWDAVSGALDGDPVAAFRASYLQSPLFRALATISDSAEWLVQDAGRSGPDVVARLAMLATAIDEAGRLLGDPQENWLEYGSAFEDRLAGAGSGVAALSFAPAGLGPRLSAAVHDGRDADRRRAAALPGFGGRPVLDASATPARLDPIYAPLREALGRVLNDAQLARAATGNLAVRGTGGRFGWSPERLREAGSLADRLLDALSGSAAEIPPDLRAVLLPVLRARAEATIGGLIDQARQPLPLAGGGGAEDAEARSFATAAPLLQGLRDQVALLELAETGRQLDSTAGAQARRIVEDADEALFYAAPYAPSGTGIAIWDGRPGGAATMFGVSGISALTGLVRDWGAYVGELSQTRAAPAVAFLGESGGPPEPGLAGTLGRWRDISATLSENARRTPRNALAQLERFILIDLDQMDASSCVKRLAAVVPGAGWFGERQAEIVAAVSRRCLELGTSTAYDALGEIADAFNAALGGRFPFVGAGGGAPLTDLGRIADPADPDTVRRFFARYGEPIARLAGDGGDAAEILAAAVPARASGALDPMLLDGVLLESAGLDFARALDAGRRFLGTLDAGPREGLAYAVSLDFRPNRARESGGDQIVEWRLSIGDDSIGSFDPPRPVIWRQGEPVRLTLRWARNAPNRPEQPKRPDATLDERSLTYSYDGPWAILAFVAANAAPSPELRTLPDPRPNVLRIDVPLEPNPDSAAGGTAPIERARVFLRLELRALDDRGAAPSGPPLAMPVFPAGGPGL